ncbi:MAG TPA: HEAT repeat domain-containing protein, partial [Gemmatimonadales bacterium]|nr:HEAT repeat domain-containing protein [Gemmatimonadales bacterium]
PAGDAFLRDLYGRLTLAQLKERVIRELGESPNDANLDWIERIARNPSENSELRERAIRVIGEDHHETQRLRSLYTTLSQVELKERVIRVVGETGDADAIAWLKAVAVNNAEPLPVRERALRVLGEQIETPYLREVYDRLGNTELQERVLRALGEAGGEENLRFVRRVALDSTADRELRDRALRVLSEAGIPTTDLVKLYDAMRDAELRDRVIKLLAERGDREARTKLADIAQNDPDPDLRERARRRN